MDEELAHSIEFEVSKQIAKGRSDYRGFLEKLFVRLIWAFGILGAAAAGLFYFFLGRSAKEAEERLINEVSSAVIEYRIDQDLQKRVGVITDSIVDAPAFKSRIDGLVTNRATPILQKKANEEVDLAVADQLGKEIELLKQDNVERLVRRAASRSIKSLEGKVATLEGSVAAPHCVFAVPCPDGFEDHGAGGFIQQDGNACPSGMSTGAPLPGGWHWCHPRICCKR